MFSDDFKIFITCFDSKNIYNFKFKKSLVRSNI